MATIQPWSLTTVGNLAKSALKEQYPGLVAEPLSLGGITNRTVTLTLLRGAARKTNRQHYFF